MSGVARVDAGCTKLGFVPPKLRRPPRAKRHLNRKYVQNHQKSDAKPFFSQSP
jgi:hypothetical protein